MPQPIREEDLKTITEKVYALYAKHGPDGISMDEVSRQASISKATLYRYFISKEDIVRGMVNVLIDHLDSLQFDEIRGIDDVVDGIKKIYRKSILIAALTGSAFMTDLKKKLPGMYADYRAALDAVRERSATFFRLSVESGYLRDFPFPLVSMYLQKMLPMIINMDFLEKNRMNLEEAIREYCRMFLCQILREEYLFVAQVSETYDFAEELSNILQDELFIDSIRR